MIGYSNNRTGSVRPCETRGALTEDTGIGGATAGTILNGFSQRRNSTPEQAPLSFQDCAMTSFDSNLSLQIDRAVQGVERTTGRTQRLWQMVLALLLRRLP